MKIWFLPADRKVTAQEVLSPEADLQNGGVQTIYLAKNAREGCALVFRGEDAECGKTYTVRAEGRGVGVFVFTQAYQKVEIAGRESASYPDGLIPGGKFVLEAQRNQGVYFQVSTAIDNWAGATLFTAIVSEGETEILRVNIPVYVFDFAYPNAMHAQCVMGIGYGLDRYPTEARRELYAREYDFLLAHHVCPYDLPYDILDDRADAYMDDPRVTRFRIPYSEDDEKILAMRQKLMQKPEWLNKGYFYCVDEPSTPALLQDLKKVGERLSHLWQGYHMVSPFFVNLQTDEKTDAVSFMSTLTDIYCPKTFCYTPRTPENDAVQGVRYFYSKEQTAKEKPFAQRMREVRAEGGTVWWYVCWEPGEPYANLFVDMPGLSHRELFWQQKAAGVDGFLYWSADYWKHTPNPWQDMRTVPQLSGEVYGDGSLLYPGDEVGLPGTFCGSMRLESVRAGIEDYELLTIADHVLGSWVTEEYLREITQDILRYNRDSQKFNEVRRTLGLHIERVLKEESAEYQ